MNYTKIVKVKTYQSRQAHILLLLLHILLFFCITFSITATSYNNNNIYNIVFTRLGVSKCGQFSANRAFLCVLIQSSDYYLSLSLSL